MNNITTIAFDADDTLWINEPYFQEAEKEFCGLLEDYLPQDAVSRELFRTEMQNLHLYGYGVKGFMLCMLETLSRITEGKASLLLLDRIISIGQDLLQRPILLLDGVTETLASLKEDYRLVVATKGDMLDQERKLEKSGLLHYFHHIEIMSDKKASNYEKLLKHLDCAASSFLMVGNAMKSDILPVLEIGARAAYIPYHMTWAHEQHQDTLEQLNFKALKRIDDLIELLSRKNYGKL